MLDEPPPLASPKKEDLMAAERLSMRKLRELLRQSIECTDGRCVRASRRGD